jgi:hypothetical protein
MNDSAIRRGRKTRCAAYVKSAVTLVQLWSQVSGPDQLSNEYTVSNWLLNLIVTYTETCPDNAKRCWPKVIRQLLVSFPATVESNACRIMMGKPEW